MTFSVCIEASQTQCSHRFIETACIMRILAMAATWADQDRPVQVVCSHAEEPAAQLSVRLWVNRSVHASFLSRLRNGNN